MSTKAFGGMAAHQSQSCGFLLSLFKLFRPKVQIACFDFSTTGVHSQDFLLYPRQRSKLGIHACKF